MIKEILTYPKNKEILTQISTPVENIEEIQDLIQDLKDTLHNSTGVGISAIQIGEPKQICIIHINGQDKVLINPTITKSRGEVKYREGCLSAPGTYVETTRYQKVWIDYIDENGRKRELAEGGLCSVIAQHEIDHFKGWCEVFNEVDKENEDGEEKE